MLLGGGQMQLVTTLKLLQTATYHSVTFGCLSMWRLDAVVSNATLAYKCTQPNTKFKTGSETVAAFLGVGQLKLSAMLLRLITSSC